MSKKKNCVSYLVVDADGEFIDECNSLDSATKLAEDWVNDCFDGNAEVFIYKKVRVAKYKDIEVVDL